MNRLRSVAIALAVMGLGAALCPAAGAEVPTSDSSNRAPSPAVTAGDGAAAGTGKRPHDGFFARLSLGAAYLHESWNPSGGGSGAVFTGAGTSLEASVGKSLRPGLIVGGLWRLVALSDPNESYRGTTYITGGTDRFLNVVAAFVDYYPIARRGLHLGGSAGLLMASNLDRAYGTLTTGWGAALSVHAGYEVYFSRRWSIGAVAGLTGYRDWLEEANVSSTSNGLLPTVAVAFTFD